MLLNDFIHCLYAKRFPIKFSYQLVVFPRECSHLIRNSICISDLIQQVPYIALKSSLACITLFHPPTCSPLALTKPSCNVWGSKQKIALFVTTPFPYFSHSLYCNIFDFDFGLHLVVFRIDIYLYICTDWLDRERS